MSRNKPRKGLEIISDQPSASARRPAGGGAEPSGARRCSVRAVPDLRHRPAAERLVGRQQWPGHHPGRHPSRPRHPGPREGHRAEPQCPALTPPPSSPWARREAVEVFDTNTGVVLQNYIALGQDSSGSYSGIAYSADGKHLVFSQDSSNVTIAKVTAEGLLEDDAQVSVPPNNSFINCFPNSPSGAYAQTLRHVLYSEHFLSRRRRALKGWQERLCPAEPERYAYQDRPDRDAAEAGCSRSASATRRTAS